MKFLALISVLEPVEELEPIAQCGMRARDYMRRGFGRRGSRLPPQHCVGWAGGHGTRCPRVALPDGSSWSLRLQST